MGMYGFFISNFSKYLKLLIKNYVDANVLEIQNFFFFFDISLSV